MLYSEVIDVPYNLMEGLIMALGQWKAVKVFWILVLIALVSGCAAVGKTIDYGEMKADVKMSESIFLSPTNAERTVYVQARNSSSNQYATSLLDSVLQSDLRQKGYTLVLNPAEATYILQANIRYVGEFKEGMDYGNTFSGASLGALAGLGLSNSRNAGSGAAVGAIAGGLIGLMLDAATRVTTCIAVVEIQITERLAEGEDITGQQVKKTEWTAEAKPQGGLGAASDPAGMTVRKQRVTSDRAGTKIYSAGVAARAAQIGLDVDAASNKLIEAAARQIAGIF